MERWVAFYKHIYVCKHLGTSSILRFLLLLLFSVCGYVCARVFVCCIMHTEIRGQLFGRPFSSALSRLSSGVAATLCTANWHPVPSLPFIWAQRCPAFYAGSRIKLQLSGSSVKHFYLLSHPPTLPP